ncbi:NUDIX hydrolase [Candidatus Uhrbacteria bacterium]|nr:NUDIX hydrolase [Candidatus Uhrbacteria bacterium]
MKKGPFEILSSTPIYKNPWINVREDAVIRPDGSQGIFGVVEMLPGVSVVAINKKMEVLLAYEYKYAIEEESIELISGALDPGESIEQAAARELKEETGMVASEWIGLETVTPFTTVIRSPNHLMLAKGIHLDPDHVPDQNEPVTTISVPFKEAIEMVMDGRITHGASCVGILKAARLLGL